MKQLIKQIFEREGKILQSIDYIFCSDDYLLAINKQYLSHDTFTDVISFDLSDTSSAIGEVYISIERVKENARSYASTFLKELNRVMIHGALHLCGYADKTVTEKQDMHDLEDKYLSTI